SPGPCPQYCEGVRRRRLLALLRLRLEPVAHAVAGLDERVPRRGAVDLVAELPDEDVYRAVAIRVSPAPERLKELVPGDDAPALGGERVQERELRRREAGALAGDERRDERRVDPQLLDLDRLAPLDRRRAHAATRGDLDARDELFHRERLDDVVVGAEL